jgi:molecular chaperone IbpA
MYGCLRGPQNAISLLGELQMNNLTKYNAANLDQLMERIHRNSIGMEDYFDRIFSVSETFKYPPYNLININHNESKLEIALAGFKRKEVDVYTENGKLFIEGKKENSEEKVDYAYKGMAQRSFARAWALAEDTEVGSVTFEDGLLTVVLKKVIPEAHRRKDYL